MKKNIFFILFVLFIFGISARAACPIDKIKSGDTCSAMSEANLNITPDKVNTQNQSLPNPNKDTFAPSNNKPSTVQDLGKMQPSANNSPSGAYSSDCQFGVCPPKLNNREFNK